MGLSKSPYVSECMVFQGPSGVRTSGSVSSLKLNAADAECMLAKEWSSIMLRQFLQTDRKRKRDFTGSLSKTSQTTLEFVSCIVFDRLNWTPTPPASKSYFRVKVLLCFCSLGQWSKNLNIKKKKTVMIFGIKLFNKETIQRRAIKKLYLPESKSRNVSPNEQISFPNKRRNEK